MRKISATIGFGLFIISIAFLAPSAFADGIIIPEPPNCDPGPCNFPSPITQLAIEYHRVRVSIDDQIAITKVDQVFRNDGDRQVEGTYIFPIPARATITEFVLWIDGEPVEGKILTREEARQTYEQIVRTMRDPALLEYIDRGAVQASIFPILPGETRRIELEYTEVLSAENGLLHYVYPLSTEKFSTQPLEEVSISVRTNSSVPIRAIYSPSHDISLDRMDEFSFLAGYEGANVLPDKDFDLYFSVAKEDIGLNLITFRDRFGEDEDGYFLLIAAPSVEADRQKSIAKDVIFVLDRSGSMEGEKFRQAQDALKFVLDHLNPQDRFNIIVFSTGTNAFASSLQPASAASQAKQWVDRLSSRGSTDINLALLEALSMADDERPTMLLFLTDGLATEGVTHSQQILDNIADARPSNLRLFSFGVGYEVDTLLLDTLSQENHGATTYVKPNQEIDEAVSGFYSKINDPVLLGLTLDFGDITVYDLYPDPLPDLFSGSQLVVVGRYKGSGTDTIELRGEVNGEFQSLSYPDQRFKTEGGPTFLPRLWATRKIGALLNAVRLGGPEQELIDQIVKLSIRYGIITPYTSYLVTETNPFGLEAQESIASEAYREILSTPTAVSGAGAVERAAAEAAISGAHIPAALPQSSVDLVRIAGAYTFRMVDGVWMDTRFEPQEMDLIRVPFLSNEYFDLAKLSETFAAAFALGERVLIVVDDVAYEVVGADEQGDEMSISEIADEQIIEISPEGIEPDPAEEQQDPSSFGCWGLAFGLGLVLVPLSRKKFRRV